MELTLAALCRGIPGLEDGPRADAVVTRVTADSREAGPGVLFVAVHGSSGDGHAFAAAALEAGCPAVVVQDRQAVPGAEPGRVLVAGDTRPMPALLARRLAGDPDLTLKTAAVTGTNGKTTTAFLLRALLGAVHGRCGLVGTIEYDDGLERRPAPLTTPGGPVFFELLGRMLRNGCRGVAMEISSHALDQGRTAGLELDVAVMTNLGRDHLDYHGDMARYLAAKARIIELLRPAMAGAPAGAVIINRQDEQLRTVDVSRCRHIGFAADPRQPAHDAELRVVAATLRMDGTHLELDWQGRRLGLDSPLVGRFNVENLTAALAAGLALGCEAEACCAALAAVPQVPGRLERLSLPNGAIAVVDYAHTHDALAAVLGACRELTDGRLLAVFGCGGDRDRGKRPLMGAVVARDADLAWITSDNPRGEEPASICAQIAEGFAAQPEPRARLSRVVVDRRSAIHEALAAALPGDIVIVAGKGHEDYQLVGDRRLDFDDRQVIRDWVREQGA
ncbi:MAG: UDP-N-acetylmuramoyl-L-alanyl-D-glutamate--2,6-diaminopimelate ligase [bacterium]|nr:UDP-N-acetylmuramoyl-L-alanyl-D-glutamate--2,6-diaminopimelate ligase [bacterium]